MDFDGLKYSLKAIATCADDAQRLQHVNGYLLDIQGYTLMKLACDGPGVGAIVEIGSFMGRSTCFLALGSQRAHREVVHAVDHFTGSPEHQAGANCEIPAIVQDGTTFHEFEKNIAQAGVGDYVRPIQASSREAAAAWDGPIRLLFIDGDHSYEASREDFEAWVPFVVPGGLIAFHDIGHWPGVTQFYKELLATDPNYTQLLGVAGLNVVIKGAAAH